MIIDILCPTRGRPNLARRMYDSACDTAKYPDYLRFWFYLSDNDPVYENANGLPFLGDLKSKVSSFTGKDAPTSLMWNYLAKEAYKANGDLFLLMGDDVIFETEGWDEIYRNSVRSIHDGIFVIAPNDGRGSGVPHPCVSRRWIETLKYFVNPVFLHWGVDSYTEKLAHKVGRFISLPNVSIKHAKVGEAIPSDDTHKRIRSGVWHERDMEVIKLMDRYIDTDVQLLREVMA